VTEVQDDPQAAKPWPEGPAVHVASPTARTTPYIFASPHSGRDYPEAFLAACTPPLSVLRRSEDAYVDLLVDTAPKYGAVFMAARFPRVYIDPSRAPDELDAAMFTGIPKGAIGALTARAAAGLGLISRLSADGRPLYAAPVDYDVARQRIAACYTPYHRRLNAEIAAARALFGEAIIIDCHSMPSASARGADIVLGDRYGASCSRALVARAEAHFRDLGFAVVRNRPYAGGYTTEHYGRPASGVQALQVEINRGLYLNELAVAQTRGFSPLRRTLEEWIARMSADAGGVSLAAE
jgi:N-formylglutamate amidohydrolase